MTKIERDRSKVTSPAVDSVITAVSKDRDFALEEWKSTQESISQFNELGLRVRVFGIGSVFLVVGYAIKSGDSLLFNQPWLHSSAVAVLFALFLLGAVFWLDRGYYTPLLIAAVAYGMELERGLRGDQEIIDQDALSRMRGIPIPTERKVPKGQGTGADQTHICGKSGYISHHVSVEVPGISKTLNRLYAIVAVVLISVAVVLSLNKLPDRKDTEAGRSASTLSPDKPR
jgi:hypothetical protein